MLFVHIRNLVPRWLLISALVGFATGGLVSGWIMNDNNLLQGTNTQAEIDERIAQRRIDIFEAVLVGGLIVGLGTVSLV
ncbi:MAG: hypothetical protein HYX67_14300 [Candidatus Melainabacteria bacterium]|nr:hypothetical protein [Candidatus Melainabacteria bacterium]